MLFHLHTKSIKPTTTTTATTTMSCKKQMKKQPKKKAAAEEPTLFMEYCKNCDKRIDEHYHHFTNYKKVNAVGQAVEAGEEKRYYCCEKCSAGDQRRLLSIQRLKLINQSNEMLKEAKKNEGGVDAEPIVAFAIASKLYLQNKITKQQFLEPATDLMEFYQEEKYEAGYLFTTKMIQEHIGVVEPGK